MDPQLFRTDLAQVPDRLEGLALLAAAGDLRWPVQPAPGRVLLIGMGSSWFAATAAAQRLRAAGLDAVAELASAELTWPPSPELLVIAISASGESVETIGFAERHRGRSTVVALTNTPESTLARQTDHVVLMHAGPEVSGVACRSYRHTLAQLLVLEAQLTGAPDVADTLQRSAAASAHLLDGADEWLPEVLGSLDGGDGTWFLAPTERWCSALQSALMIREVSRRMSDGCETGDWSHVDAYLTSTLRYRAVVFTGSAHEPAAIDRIAQRSTPAVAIGGPFAPASVVVRYPHDDDRLVAALTEVLVAELVADSWRSAS